MLEIALLFLCFFERKSSQLLASHAPKSQNMKRFGYINKVDPRLWAVSISLIISFVLGFNFYINADGILYLNTANSFLTNSALIPPPGAKWPFYPMLIAGLSAITGVTAQTSALIWQALFLALLIVSFINIVRVLGGNRVIQHLAAIVILLHPDLNENRNMIIRDFGYWAFLLTSFYYLLRYMDKPAWSYAVLWTISISIAILFRIEGIVIAGLAPLLIFFLPKENYWHRTLHVARFYAIWIILGIAVLAVVFWRNHAISLSALGRIDELPRWWQHLTGAFFIRWENVRDTINLLFPEMKSPHVSVFLIGGLVTYVFYRLLNTLGIFFFALVLYGQIKHTLKDVVTAPKRYVLYGFLAINLFIIIVFVTNHWFVASRYLMATSLILLLWVPFTLLFIAQLWQQSTYHRRFPWLGKSLALLITIALFIDCYISFGPSHAFVRQSADWIQNHVPQDATLYSNNAPLAYYSMRSGTDWYAVTPITSLPNALKNNSWKQYDYAAFYINRNDKKSLQEVPALFAYAPLAKFNNSHGDLILIYKVKQS